MTVKIRISDTEVKATTNGDVLFPTPVGRSFKCHREIEIPLTDPRYPDLQIKLLLRELTLEPFLFKNDDFGPGKSTHEWNKCMHARFAAFIYVIIGRKRINIFARNWKMYSTSDNSEKVFFKIF